MAIKKKVLKEEPQQAVVVAPPKRELVLEGDPEQQLEFAHKAASTLMKWVKQKPKKVVINGEQYLEFGDWQILARFYGATLSIDWTKPIERDGKIHGYEAKALVLRQGEVIASAEGMCTKDEKRWKSADEYAIRSMAQTRTGAKALRNAFGWVAELAGMKSTPAEEMDGVYDKSPIKADAKITVSGTDTDEAGIPTDEMEQKKIIITFVKQLDKKLDWKNMKELERFISDLTQLALVPQNFPAIIHALETEVRYKNM